MFGFRVVVGFTAIFARLVSAQDFTAFPACSLPCMGTIVPPVCDLTDIPCICGNQPLMANVTTCVLGACSIKDGLKTQQVTYAMCQIKVRDIGPSMNAIALGFGVVALIVVVARIATRLIVIASKLGWDDYWILVAVAAMFPCTASVFIMTKHGLGRDISGVTSIDDLDTVLLWYYVAMLCYVLILCATKFSLLCLYLRVFPTPRSRRTSYILLAITACFFIALTCTVIFQCTPISGAWQVWDGERPATCVNQNAMVISTSSINIFLDLAIIVLPLPELYRLNLSIRKKIQVMVVFCLGFFVTIVAVVRMQFLVKFQNSNNFTYDNGAAAYWSVIELYVSIICVSLPALTPLLKMILPRVFGATSVDQYKNSYGGSRARSNVTNSSIKVRSEITRTVGPYSIQGDSLNRSDSDELHLVGMDPKFRMHTRVSAREV